MLSCGKTSKSKCNVRLTWSFVMLDLLKLTVVTFPGVDGWFSSIVRYSVEGVTSLCLITVCSRRPMVSSRHPDVIIVHDVLPATSNEVTSRLQLGTEVLVYGDHQFVGCHSRIEPYGKIIRPFELYLWYKHPIWIYKTDYIYIIACYYIPIYYN